MCLLSFSPVACVRAHVQAALEKSPPQFSKNVAVTLRRVGLSLLYQGMCRVLIWKYHDILDLRITVQKGRRFPPNFSTRLENGRASRVGIFYIAAQPIPTLCTLVSLTRSCSCFDPSKRGNLSCDQFIEVGSIQYQIL
jgi:hypothetical protein